MALDTARGAAPLRSHDQEMCSGVARWYSPRGALALDQLAEHYAELASRALGCTASPGVHDLARCREIVAKEWGMSV